MRHHHTLPGLEVLSALNPTPRALPEALEQGLACKNRLMSSLASMAARRSDLGPMGTSSPACPPPNVLNILCSLVISFLSCISAWDRHEKTNFLGAMDMITGVGGVDGGVAKVPVLYWEAPCWLTARILNR